MHESYSTVRDSHYRLSKKVAQLTKVIVHLNTANENIEFDKKKLRESFIDKIKFIEDETKQKVNFLENETREKERSTREVTALLREKESEFQKWKASFQDEVKAREEYMISEHEKEKKLIIESCDKAVSSQAIVVLELSKKLEDQTKVYHDDTTALKERLTSDCHNQIKSHCEELSRIHSEEKKMIKTCHDEAIFLIRADALTHEKNTLENAVAAVKMQYEEYIAQGKDKQISREKEMNSIIEKYDEEVKFLKENVCILLQKMEDQSVQQREELESLRQQLNKDYEKNVIAMRDELDQCHTQEIYSLRSQYEEALNVVKADAQKHEHIAVESTIEALKNEHEQNICDLNSRWTKKCISIRAEVTEKIEKDVRVLQDDMVRLINENADVHYKNEQKLNDLRKENDYLRSKIAEFSSSIEGQFQNIDSLIKENEELKHSIETIDHQNGSLKSKSKELEERCHIMSREVNDKNAKIMKLEAELNDSISERIRITRYSAIETKVHLTQPLTIARSLRSELQLLKTETHKLSEIYSSTLKDVMKVKQDRDLLLDEVNGFKFLVSQLERQNDEEKVIKELLVDELEVMKHTAENTEHLRNGERLTFTKELEEMKAQFKMEQGISQQDALEVQNKLNNEILTLRSKMICQDECYARKKQILENDCQQKLNDMEVYLYRVKDESAVDRDNLLTERNELKDQLTLWEKKCIVLSQNIEKLEERLNLIRNEYDGEKEVWSMRYTQTIEEKILSEQQKEDTFRENVVLSQKMKELERERERFVDRYELKITRMIRGVISGSKEVKGLKRALRDLQIASKLELDEFKHEWENSFLSGLSERISAMVTRVRNRQIMTERAHSEALSKLNDVNKKQIEIATQEANDAKRILFHSVREHETKLERTIRQLNQEHNLLVTKINDENKMKCDDLSHKLVNLGRELEIAATSISKKELEIQAQEHNILQLTMKVAELTKFYHDKMSFVQPQYERANGSLRTDNESSLQEKFCILQREVKSMHQQLYDANESREQSVTNAHKYEEQIKRLQEEREALVVSEMHTREKMLLYKRELENRDMNFNKISTGGERGKRVEKIGAENIHTGALRMIENITKTKKKVHQQRNQNQVSNKISTREPKIKEKVPRTLPKITNV